MGQSIKHLMKFDLEEIKLFAEYLDSARKSWAEGQAAAAAEAKARAGQ